MLHACRMSLVQVEFAGSAYAGGEAGGVSFVAFPLAKVELVHRFASSWGLLVTADPLPARSMTYWYYCTCIADDTQFLYCTDFVSLQKTI